MNSSNCYKDEEGNEMAESTVNTEPDDANDSRMLQIRKRNQENQLSLADCPTTPTSAKILIPLVTLVAHALFLYGQTAEMWRLLYIQDLDVWVNATTATATTAMDTLGMPHENHIFSSQQSSSSSSTVVRSFTFGSAVQDLWRASLLPSKVKPRVTCIVLILCSGLWPHIKLVLLQRTFWRTTTTPMVHKRRQQTLHWLSAAGKWSLADILVVCVMMAVLNLEWQIDPVVVQKAIVDHFDQLVRVAKVWYTEKEFCGMLLGYDCALHAVECKACTSVVKNAYAFPKLAKGMAGPGLAALAVSGGGMMQLKVEGMRGIYAFCLAVVLSILLSLVVDVYDGRARHHASADRAETAAVAFAATEEEPPELVPPTPSTLDPLEIAGPENRLDEAVASTTTPAKFTTWSLQDHVAPPITMVLVVVTIFAATMKRDTSGAIPQVLYGIFNMESWTRVYSFQTIGAQTVSDGSDAILAGTFSLFVLIAPTIRCLLIVIVGYTNNNLIIRSRLVGLIDYMGAFCAWEVLFLAVVMVDLLMPGLTNTIVTNPKCVILSQTDDSCLMVEFELMRGAWLAFIGGFLLVLLANRVVKEHQRSTSSTTRDPQYQQLSLKESKGGGG